MPLIYITLVLSFTYNSLNLILDKTKTNIEVLNSRFLIMLINYPKLLNYTNEKFDHIWPCHVMSRDQDSFSLINCQGSILIQRHLR